MQQRLFISFFALFALASCGDFPKDPRSTLERVRTERAFRVGLVSKASDSGVDPATKQLVEAISTAVPALPTFVRGETEVLLIGLEEGQLDLVIGRFEKKSPWSARVTFGPPLKTDWQGKSQLLLRPVMQNGENGWIALIERQARKVAPSPQ
jgi:hypothetical protein